MTLAKFAPRFLTYSENNNKHSSVVSKRQILDDHVVPFFGEMALSAIGLSEIEDFKALMRTKKSAARARRGGHLPRAGPHRVARPATHLR
jgi:hypothetical protein